MTNDQYLAAVLKAQTLAPDGPEMAGLQEHRAAIDALLPAAFADCSPTIRYGGSRAKGTMIKDDYDLDIICYLPHDEDGAGSTLEEIYHNVRDALAGDYTTQEKTSAIRLRGHDNADFHIDVVPGRFTDTSKGDAFLYQKNREKTRLKTNLQVHIDYIRNSGVTDAIRLMKLWRYQNGVRIRTFPLDLLVIELLKGRQSHTLSSQVEHVLIELRDAPDGTHIEDPANPYGNDPWELLDDSTRQHLSDVARTTLAAVTAFGWEHVFGPVAQAAAAAIVPTLQTIAVQSPRTRPWCEKR